MRGIMTSKITTSGRLLIARAKLLGFAGGLHHEVIFSSKSSQNGQGVGVVVAGQDRRRRRREGRWATTFENGYLHRFHSLGPPDTFGANFSGSSPFVFESPCAFSPRYFLVLAL